MEVKRTYKNTEESEHCENKDCVTYSVGEGLKQGLFNQYGNAYRIKLLICVFSLCVLVTQLLCIAYILCEIFNAESIDASRLSTCDECKILTRCDEEETTEHSTRGACCRGSSISAYTHLISLITSQKLLSGSIISKSSSGLDKILAFQASPSAELKADGHLIWMEEMSVAFTQFTTELSHNNTVFIVPRSGWYNVESIFQTKSAVENSQSNFRHSLVQLKNKYSGNISRVLLHSDIQWTKGEMAFQSTHLSALFWLDRGTKVYPLLSNINLLYNAKSCNRFTMYFIHD
ncbi:uncharacterized protein LOC133202538 [Saccostrea echinata]|uniref:uncharacterized protein LOC133202538 n=1 Tax=Saccostrea echinata TaxID=191078 RepID=UPI002A7F95C8|nr:uncharacterized protein LOC133202538 [Saccostrea echinata]